MIAAGCDVGSLTAKAYIMNEKGKLAGEIIRVKSTTIDSATEVMEKALSRPVFVFPIWTVAAPPVTAAMKFLSPK